ncbi:MAG TPA: DUF2802 domain-containing protein [Steroidobacteraceae bacterium]|jgi:hypothetical protein|nr:DUF2802 domain-containing protein [Steroidobacteraceae bacterium]
MILNISTALSLAAATLGTLSLVSVLVTIQAMRGWRSRCLALESSLMAVRRELELVASISLKTGRRVKRVESEYSGVAERMERVELRSPARSFESAIDSARRGTDSGRLTQQFGLSRCEADLVWRLHGRKKIA